MIGVMVLLTICSRIVVPYDHSESSKKALKMALEIARQDENIELDAVMVLHPEIPLNYQLVNTGQHRDDQRETELEIRMELEQQLRQIPNKTRAFILLGNPAKVILDFVKERAADFIVMGSRGLSGLEEMFLGSVSHHIVQKAECPVLIVKGKI
jgi:nucleotide-binding universal stress UspA family protein